MDARAGHTSKVAETRQYDTTFLSVRWRESLRYLVQVQIDGFARLFETMKKQTVFIVCIHQRRTFGSLDEP